MQVVLQTKALIKVSAEDKVNVDKLIEDSVLFTQESDIYASTSTIASLEKMDKNAFENTLLSNLKDCAQIENICGVDIIIS